MYRVVDYILDPATSADAISIMAARVGLTPDQYAPLLAGTKLLTLEEAKEYFQQTDGFDSLLGSSRISDEFNRKYDVYREPQNLDAYIDASFTPGSVVWVAGTHYEFVCLVGSPNSAAT